MKCTTYEYKYVVLRIFFDPGRKRKGEVDFDFFSLLWVDASIQREKSHVYSFTEYTSSINTYLKSLASGTYFRILTVKTQGTLL